MAYLTILISTLFRHVFGQFSEKFVRMVHIGRQNEDDNCKDVLRAQNLAAIQIERSQNWAPHSTFYSDNPHSHRVTFSGAFNRFHNLWTLPKEDNSIIWERSKIWNSDTAKTWLRFKHSRSFFWPWIPAPTFVNTRSVPAHLVFPTPLSPSLLWLSLSLVIHWSHWEVALDYFDPKSCPRKHQVLWIICRIKILDLEHITASFVHFLFSITTGSNI